MSRLPIELVYLLIQSLQKRIKSKTDLLVTLKSIRLVCHSWSLIAEEPLFALAKPIEIDIKSLSKYVSVKKLDAVVRHCHSLSFSPGSVNFGHICTLLDKADRVDKVKFKCTPSWPQLPSGPLRSSYSQVNTVTISLDEDGVKASSIHKLVSLFPSVTTLSASFEATVRRDQEPSIDFAHLKSAVMFNQPRTDVTKHELRAILTLNTIRQLESFYFTNLQEVLDDAILIKAIRKSVTSIAFMERRLPDDDVDVGFDLEPLEAFSSLTYLDLSHVLDVDATLSDALLNWPRSVTHLTVSLSKSKILATDDLAIPAIDRRSPRILRIKPIKETGTLQYITDKDEMNKLIDDCSNLVSVLMDLGIWVAFVDKGGSIQMSWKANVSFDAEGKIELPIPRLRQPIILPSGAR